MHVYTKRGESSADSLYTFYSVPNIVILTTVKPVIGGHLNIDKTKVLMENGSLMKVKSVAEFSPWSIL